MAITYHSGERIQGASNAEGTPVVITGWTTNNATDVAGLLTKTSTTDSWSDCCNNTDSVENYATGTAYKFKYSNASTSATHNVRVGIAQSAVTDNSGITHGFLLTDYAYELDGTTLTQIDSSPSATDYYVMEIATSGAITRKQYASDGTLKYSNSSGTITGTGWFQNSTMYYGGETIKITNIPLVDEKATLLGASSSILHSQTNISRDYWGYNTRAQIGVEFASGHTLVGKSIIKVTLRLRTSDNTSTNTYSVNLFASDGSIKREFGTGVIGDLNYSTTEENGSNNTTTEQSFTASSAVTVATDDVLGIKNLGSAEEIYLGAWESAVTDESIAYTTQGGSSWSNYASESIYYKVYGVGSNVPLQTQFEETDTRKQYSLLYTTSGGSIGWVEMGTGGFLS